jgi:hypothetical protein
MFGMGHGGIWAVMLDLGGLKGNQSQSIRKKRVSSLFLVNSAYASSGQAKDARSLNRLGMPSLQWAIGISQVPDFFSRIRLLSVMPITGKIIWFIGLPPYCPAGRFYKVVKFK